MNCQVTQIDTQKHVRKVFTNVSSASSKFELFEFKFKSSKVQINELYEAPLKGLIGPFEGFLSRAL